MAGAVHEAHVAYLDIITESSITIKHSLIYTITHQLVFEAVHDESVLLGGSLAGVADGALTLLVLGPEDLGVGVAQLDGDVALELILEADGVHA